MENGKTRYIGMDVHKAYFVAVGVDAQREVVFRSGKVSVYQLESWAEKNLNPDDAVVLEMSTNSYLVYDVLQPYVQSVTVVHPPHVKLVTKVAVKTDQKAALALGLQAEALAASAAAASGRQRGGGRLLLCSGHGSRGIHRRGGGDPGQ